MFPETAHRIFQIIGREDAPRGVVTAEQVPDALQRLSAAVEQEKGDIKAAQKDAGRTDDETEAAAAKSVTLGQRAFPLIEMLRAAQQRNVDVTWGV